MTLTIHAGTHIGRVRDVNQDHFAFEPPERPRGHRFGTLMALADGMGGPAGGAIASRMAIEVLFDTYYNAAGRTIPEALLEGFERANAAVIDRSANEPSLGGMGCTLTAAVIKDMQLFHAHVGDTRGYLIRGNDIRQFTKDHRYVTSLVKAGAISAEAAKDHPDNHLLTRAVGLKPEIQVNRSRQPLQLNSGDHVLLCCDGLWETIDDEALLGAVRDGDNPETVCNRLIAAANENGGEDNITVLVARIKKSGWFSRFFSAS